MKPQYGKSVELPSLLPPEFASNPHSSPHPKLLGEVVFSPPYLIIIMKPPHTRMLCEKIYSINVGH